MLFSDVYKTIDKPTEGVFKDKGSKFIAYAYPFKQEAELKPIIHNLKQQHPKANHLCFAYRLTPDRSIFKINDDGEPAGTAGRPILNTILSKDLTNLIVVVVRYFGGTLLGVSGLIKAYKLATEEALVEAEIIEKKVRDVYHIQFEYLQMNEVMSLVKEENLQIISQNFDLACEISVAINQSEISKVIDKLEKIMNVKHRYLYTI